MTAFRCAKRCWRRTMRPAQAIHHHLRVEPRGADDHSRLRQLLLHHQSRQRRDRRPYRLERAADSDRQCCQHYALSVLGDGVQFHAQFDEHHWPRGNRHGRRHDGRLRARRRDFVAGGRVIPATNCRSAIPSSRAMSSATLPAKRRSSSPSSSARHIPTPPRMRSFPTPSSLTTRLPLPHLVRARRPRPCSCRHGGQQHRPERLDLEQYLHQPSIRDRDRSRRYFERRPHPQYAHCRQFIQRQSSVPCRIGSAHRPVRR